MLKNIQIKIVLIFLIIGVITIGVIGYVNYINLQSNLSIPEDNNADISSKVDIYETGIIRVTITTMIIFILICILARSFYK